MSCCIYVYLYMLFFVIGTFWSLVIQENKYIIVYKYFFYLYFIDIIILWHLYKMNRFNFIYVCLTICVINIPLVFFLLGVLWGSKYIK